MAKKVLKDGERKEEKKVVFEAPVFNEREYLEEQKGRTSGAKADEYKSAQKEFPATMAVAHHVWAQELAKQQPSV